MAPTSGRCYLPSLEEVLTGDKVLLSWKAIATALTDETGERQTCAPVVAFLRDDHVQAILKDPSTAFAAPDDASRKEFETRTAPINVTSASNARYDIEDIKRDTEWLRKNAQINLVSALRLVMIEFQSRPRYHLTGPFSSHDAANLRDAAGLTPGQEGSLALDLEGAEARDADAIQSNFDKPESRKQRLFNTYLDERKCLLLTADYVHSIRLYNRSPTQVALSDDLASLYKMTLPPRPREELTTLLTNYLYVVISSMKQIEHGSGAVITDMLLSSEDVEINWLHSFMTETLHALLVIFQIVDSFGKDFPPSSAVNQWFLLMETHNFFGALQAVHPVMDDLVWPLKTLAPAISVALLQPARSIDFLIEREDDPTQVDDAYDSYLLAPDVLEQIHRSIINAANLECESASPAIFAWTFVLHRLNLSYQTRTEKRDNLLQQRAQENFETGHSARPTGRRNSAGSVFSIESSKFDGFLENGTTPKDIQVVEQLAAGVTAHGRVFDVISRMTMSLGHSQTANTTPLLSSRIRTVWLDLLKISYPVVGYQSEPVSTLISLLAPGCDYWNLPDQVSSTNFEDVLTTMLHDDQAMEFYFQQALDRFPFEFMPFIQISRMLCSITSLPAHDDRLGFLLQLLRRTPTLTIHLPETFQDYELVNEDENTNSFRFLEDYPLITLSSSWSRRHIEDDAYRIPAGTLGRFITDSGKIALVDYGHSGISLLARQLEISLAKEGYRTALSMPTPDEVAEVISFFATLVRVEYVEAQRSTSSQALAVSGDSLLHEMSKHISSGKDIITVVCDTLDYYLQEDMTISDETAISILNSCIKFMDSVLLFEPSRVWSYLARCELIGSDSGPGKLSKIVGVLDLVSERYELLASCVSFFSHLVETGLTSAVQRRSMRDIPNRQGTVTNPWIGTVDKVLAKVTYSIAQLLVDVFENTSTWRFGSDINRISLVGKVVPVLDKIVAYSFRMGDPDSSDNLTSCLQPAARYIVDSFLSPASSSLRFQPFLISFSGACALSDSMTSLKRTEVMRSEIKSTLAFSTTLLQVAALLGQSSTMFETYLFKCSILLARLCAASEFYLEPALDLLCSMVVIADNGGGGEPPSLLGYLGPQVSRTFLQLLSTLGQPFKLQSEVRTTWTFLSSILKHRQQWMSNCLLTGLTPREAMAKGDKGTKPSKDSVLEAAFGRLNNINDLETSEILAVLEFVASAQNFWPWTVFTLQKDATYLEGLMSYVGSLKSASITAKPDLIKTGQNAKIAAYVAEILAMQLYHSRHLGNASTLAENLVTNIDYYLRDGVEVGGYNRSLHSSFEKNFSQKYDDCSLSQFKQTKLRPKKLGTSYCYDLQLADRMLNFNPGWLGRNKNGFRMEMELANANLSLVDAQIALFHSWELLLLELSAALPTNDTVIRQTMQVTQQCLEANQLVPGATSIFVKLTHERAHLALALAPRLVKSVLPIKDVNQLLGATVSALSAVDEPFEAGTVTYYRTLLKALFVILRAYHLSDSKEGLEGHDGATISAIQTILNILDRVVAKGIRSLAGLIHEKDTAIVPEDFALLTAILQACLSLPGIEHSSTQILNIMANYDTMSIAAALFSWSDKLGIQGDPVYGELSILFLVELSTLPSIAEHIASVSILSNLLSANLSKFMLKKELSPYSDSLFAQRCYGIWAKGFLPLMLNMLSALGAIVAPEISYVLNQFSHLLEASVDRFEAPGASRTRSSSSQYITTIATLEIHSLALLSRIITTLRISNSRDIPAVKWDAAALLENVEFWLSSKKLLKERLLPLGDRQVELRNTKSQAEDGDAQGNLLEEKVVSQLEVIRDVLSEDLE